MALDLRAAAKITGQHLRITQLEREVARLTERATSAEQRAERLSHIHSRRALTIQRLQSRLQSTRCSRDLWKHRAMRGT